MSNKNSTKDLNSEETHKANSLNPKQPLKSNSTYIRLVTSLLIFLYSMQGFVLGLFLETIQIKLKKDFSFSEIGVFLLCSYPFSLKVFWSPIVDTYYIRKIGLRRTWALSTQVVSAGLLMFLSYNIKELLDSKKIYELSFVCFLIVFFIATQDIAIDGWATTLCGKDNCSLASSCQTIGQMIGIIFSTAGFMYLSNEKFCKQYLYKTSNGPYLTLDSYLYFLSLYFLVATVILLFISENPFQSYNYQNANKTPNSLENSGSEYFISTPNSELKSQPEEPEEPVISISETFFKIKNAFKNKNLRGFIGILLISKVGLIFSMKLTGLILIDKGYPQESLTNLSTIMTFIEIAISIKLSSLKKDFLKNYLSAYKALFFVFVFEMLILIAYENYKNYIDRYNFIFTAVLLAHSIFKTYLMLICFVSVCGFFHKITDRSIGATYITALNSSNNLSEKWPALFIFYLVDLVNYKIIGFVSILYSIGFYVLFKDKIVEYDESDESEWLSFKLEKEEKIE